LPYLRSCSELRVHELLAPIRRHSRQLVRAIWQNRHGIQHRLNRDCFCFYGWCRKRQAMLSALADFETLARNAGRRTNQSSDLRFPISFLRLWAAKRPRSQLSPSLNPPKRALWTSPYRLDCGYFSGHSAFASSLSRNMDRFPSLSTNACVGYEGDQ